LTNVPRTAVTLLRVVYRDIFPQVDETLTYWKERARQIPDLELRTQAIASIDSKRFHCQGGAVYAILAAKNQKAAIRFIVAYQTISDYLDNLCDRSTSLDPVDFRLLHQAMEDALSPMNKVKNYYELRNEQDDGGYLADLVRTCQQIIEETPTYHDIKPILLELESMYADLQVHKHVHVEERVPRLTAWYEENKWKTPTLAWYEFAAASGSTLGIFCLVSYALGGRMSGELAREIYDGYFPYMQGLHILLDYFIDQHEDEQEGDLNFCSFYSSKEQMNLRFHYFIEQTAQHIQLLPNKKFHEMVQQGLVALYLGDSKVKQLDDGEHMTKELLKASGAMATFFHWNIKMYHKRAKI
jgi:tetraprenyl-beta-curcumene synthase